MRRHGLLLLCLAVLFGSCATASPEEEIRRGIRGGYDALERAFAAQDVAAVLASRSPDFEVLGPRGRDDAKAMEAYTRNWFVMNKPPIEVRFTIRSLRVTSPDEATVTVFQEASRYQELAGKLRRNQHNVTQDETWVRTPGGWRIRRVENIRDQNRWIDGKRVDPTKPYDPDAPEYQPAPAGTAGCVACSVTTDGFAAD